MDTNEYIKKLNELNSDKDVHPEFHTFATVWIKSRQPQVYNELMSRFKNIESEIYAQHECNEKRNEIPF